MHVFMNHVSPCACTRIRRASRSLTRLYDAAVADAGITITQFAILRTLVRLGGASVTDLAIATAHERSAMTRLLRPLLEAGLVEAGDGADARSRRLAITPAGTAAIARAEPGWRDAQEKIDAGLGATQRQQLFALLAQVEELGR